MAEQGMIHEAASAVCHAERTGQEVPESAFVGLTDEERAVARYAGALMRSYSMDFWDALPKARIHVAQYGHG